MRGDTGENVQEAPAGLYGHSGAAGTVHQRRTCGLHPETDFGRTGGGMKKYLEEKLLNRLDYSKETTDEEVLSQIDDLFLLEEAIRLYPVDIRRKLKQEIFCSLRRLDILQTLIEDSSITEIMINRPAHIFVEKRGRMEEVPIQFSSEEKLLQIIQRIVGDCNRTVNEVSPIVDARLQNGSRVNVVLSPIALNGPIVTIRKFPDCPLTIDQLISWGSITKEAAEELRLYVQAGYNIFVSGGTGSGKTTFLNILSDFIPKDERIITIEDSAELQIQGIENLIRLETRNENVEGCHAITIRDLIKSSLRMRPDRIIVGEVRGSEAVDMITAFNTGHDGSMSTGHANSARDMLSRLENMILMGMDIPLAAVKQQIASAIDIMIHLGRIRDKSRRVLEITEIDGIQDGEIKMHTLYEFTEDASPRIGILQKKGQLQHVEKLKAAGLML